MAPLPKPSVLMVAWKISLNSKGMIIRKNNKKWMKNEYFIEIFCKIDYLIWVFWKSGCLYLKKVGFYTKIEGNFYIDWCKCF